MANKQSFTPEEWTKILESTMLAGMAVTAAEPSGLWGVMKEGFASSSALAQAKSDTGSTELVKAVVAEYQTSEGRAAVQEALRKRFAGAKPGDAVQRSLDNLREVSAILAAKAPGDAPAFKAWLSSISQKVAEASSDHPPKGITLGKFRAFYNNPALNRVGGLIRPRDLPRNFRHLKLNSTSPINGEQNLSM